jgi:hypothetical protein
MDFSTDDITNHIKDWAQNAIGNSGIPVLSDLANANMVHSAMAPKPAAAPMPPYKPPFGNEAAPAMPPVDKSAAPDTAVDSGDDDELRKDNPKVASSHPGFDQDALEKYLQDQKGSIDKYGADKMAATSDDIQKKNHSWQNGLAHAGSQMADSIMQGVARAGNPGFDRALTDRQQHNDEMRMGALKEENAANVAAQKSKMGLDEMSSHNALGASAASAMMPMLQKIYPGKTPAEYAAMANNPQVAAGLLPEGVKLKDAEAQMANAQANRQFNHEMALQRLQTTQGNQAMGRQEKDVAGMTKDANFVKAQGTLDKLGTARGLLEAGNVNNATAKQALQTALTFVATGGQRVNETEMKQLGGAHTVTNRVNQWMQGLDRGTLTPKDYQDMKQVIGIYEKGANQSMEDAINRAAAARAAREHETPEQARIDLGRAPAGQPAQAAPQVTPDVVAYAAKHGITPEQAMAIKQKRGGQ